VSGKIRTEKNDWLAGYKRKCGADKDQHSVVGRQRWRIVLFFVLQRFLGFFVPVKIKKSTVSPAQFQTRIKYTQRVPSSTACPVGNSTLYWSYWVRDSCSNLWSGHRKKDQKKALRNLRVNWNLASDSKNINSISPRGLAFFTPRFRKSEDAMKLVVYLYLSMIVLGVQVSVGLRLV